MSMFSTYLAEFQAVTDIRTGATIHHSVRFFEKNVQMQTKTYFIRALLMLCAMITILLKNLETYYRYLETCKNFSGKRKTNNVILQKLSKRPIIL